MIRIGPGGAGLLVVSVGCGPAPGRRQLDRSGRLLAAAAAAAAAGAVPVGRAVRRQRRRQFPARAAAPAVPAGGSAGSDRPGGSAGSSGGAGSAGSAAGGSSGGGSAGGSGGAGGSGQLGCRDGGSGRPGGRHGRRARSARLRPGPGGRGQDRLLPGLRAEHGRHVPLAQQPARGPHPDHRRPGQAAREDRAHHVQGRATTSAPRPAPSRAAGSRRPRATP